MLTILKSPPLVALLDNPIRFSLQTDNHVEEMGSNIFFTIEFTGTGFEDDWIELSWNGRVIRFVCKPVPDGSGNQVHDNSTYDMLSEWVEKLAGSLRANYYLSADFEISFSGNTLRLEARELGDQYAVSFDSSWTSADKPVSGISGSNQILRPFFKAGVQVILKVSEHWVMVGEDRQPVDSVGRVIFDIHRLFADQVFSSFRFPEPVSPLMVARPEACREYRIRYFEQYGPELEVQVVSESDSFYVLSGGVSRIQEAIYNRLGTSYCEKLGYNGYFLSWQPDNKPITRYQTEKLFYLLQEPVSRLILRRAYFFTNGTGNHSEPVSSIEDPVEKQVYELTITPFVQNVPGWESDLLDYFQVWMEDDEMNRISEIRTYRMDYRNIENDRLFLFRNSLGGYDTFRVTGEQEDSLEYERVSVDLEPGENFSERDHRLSIHTITESRQFKANTGWITPENSAWIRDFFLSRQVYRILAGKLVPIVITTTQVVHRKDRRELYSMDFEYRYSCSNEQYTREITGAVMNEDFNEDFANQ